jgi:hypothetical protein
LVSPALLAAARHALFAERCAKLLDDLDELRAMSEAGLDNTGKARLARVKLDAQADAKTIRDLLFPEDETEGEVA